MPLISRQRGPIAVYGASGYTGKLVAAELAAAKADFILSGRSEEKLRAIAEELKRDVPVRPAQLDDPASLRSLLADCAVVIDCAGPFVRYGEPVLRAAVETSTHYLDTTGEQPYMRMAFERYGPGAAEAGVAVIPAMGFDFAPGDMIAALTAEGMGELDEVVIAYAWFGFQPSRGTMLSTLDILSGGAVEWRKLQWLAAERPFGGEKFDFPEPIGRQRMLRFPAGEHITVPRHVATRRVRTLITASTYAPHPALGPLMQLLARPTGVALRTPLKRALRAAISRLPEGPSPEERTRDRYTLVCEVARGERTRRGALRGIDGYGVTAALVARGALTAASSGFEAAGALAPSQAFEPRSFLKDLDRFEIEWEVEEAERREPVRV
jgi:short subunit dehydrogenase-like uncharacterized protein